MNFYKSLWKSFNGAFNERVFLKKDLLLVESFITFFLNNLKFKHYFFNFLKYIIFLKRKIILLIQTSKAIIKT